MSGSVSVCERGWGRSGDPVGLYRLALLVLLSLVVTSCDADEPALRDDSGPGAAGWPVYGGSPGGTRYSPLSQITRENVSRLEVAWVYHTGDYEGERPGVGKTAFQATPILQGDNLYFCSPLSRIFALDAETGEERWVHDSQPRIVGDRTKTCRGVAYWRAEGGLGQDRPVRGGDGRGAGGRGTAVCEARVFMGTIDARLVAVDAATGRPCTDFGENGEVDLREGLGDVRPGEMTMTSPPTVFGDIVISGAMVADNQRVDAPGGVIRGFDVRTGELRWAFDPVPPGTPSLEDEGGRMRFHRGTPNAWSILSIDPERGLVFVPFGNPSPDFAGGQRRGFDYYGSSVVALDATSGEPVWRFQTVHQDLWDYDVASQPLLLEVERDGRSIPAVAQATKMGHLFLLDRETGEPIYPVEERPVPQTDVPGESTSPTQPFPTFPAPLHPHSLSPSDAFGFTPLDRGACRKKIEGLRNEGIFTPPSLGGSIQYPGVAGGSNWGSVAWDPERRLLVLNQNAMAQVHTLIPRDEERPSGLASRHMGISPQEGTPYLVHQEVLLSPLGVPCVPLPWGSLMAVSLETGSKVWEIPFGTTRDMLPFFPFGLDFGMPSMGGPIVTASGLVFIGASMDRALRAYDVESGELLFEGRLPAGGQATPMTYRIAPDSRQLVVIAAGGHGTLGTRSGDSVVAYALPSAAAAR